ncbi:Putative Zinc finger, RanBP2-type, WLM domain-containing protein [Septoria linicola]|uniref:Zinc finger, RanBP2-type, WLM domain-containing protein n=1 Tax=Septoria linicola TaxID=215465 RepID=A0A9Q9EMP1_9PEZI|nr:Putative Zinc finger, RanBP2-type, WLM domain-containing protein [Septoria linicola]
MSSWRPPGPRGDHRSGGPAYSGRNRQTSNGGPNGVQRSSASSLKETEALFTTYEHLSGLPRGDSALTMLRKIASVVKPIMRKRGWKVQVLAEFLPPEQNLLGLNINKGYKICIRLRYHNNPDLFLPFEECVDTMLHELSHNVWGAHDSNFHKLWDELRDEHEVLVRKGYTGEGFLGGGNRLGGTEAGFGRPQLPAHELRRLARESAQKRAQQGTLGAGSGQRLGGNPIHRGQDIRSVIADQIQRRNNNNSMRGGGCASGRSDAGQLSQQSSDQTFKTQAEEDDANNRAIAQALYELMEQEEEQKLNGTFASSKADESGGLGWTKENGLYDAGEDASSRGTTSGSHPSEEDQLKWAMEESMRGRSEAPTEMSSSPQADRKVLAVEVPSSPSTDRTLTPSPPQSPGRGAGADSLTTRPSTPAKAPLARKRPASALSPSPAKPTSRQESSGTHPAAIDLTSLPSPSVKDNDSMADQWACEICTCINPLPFLACDACGVDRPQALLMDTESRPTKNSNTARKPVSSTSRDLNVRPLPTMTAAERFPIKAPDPNASLGWKCGFCGSFMEHKWWTCSACGMLKDSS